MRFFSKLFESEDGSSYRPQPSARDFEGSDDEVTRLRTPEPEEADESDEDITVLQAPKRSALLPPEGPSERLSMLPVGQPRRSNRTQSLPPEVLAARRANLGKTDVSVEANPPAVMPSATGPSAPSESEDRQSWALLKPPADSSPYHRTPAAVSPPATETAPLLPASNPPDRLLPKVMVRVTTKSKQSFDLVEADEEREEPTDPGVGTPTNIITPRPPESFRSTTSEAAPAQVLPSGPKSARIRDRLVMQVLLGTIRGLPPSLRARLSNEDGSLERIAESPVGRLSTSLGTTTELANVLRSTCLTYREIRTSRQARSSDAGRLEKSMSQLQSCAHSFNQCDEDERAKRRELRRALQQAVTDLHLIVAERGEMALLHELERHPIAERIKLLRERFGVRVQPSSTEQSS